MLTGQVEHQQEAHGVPEESCGEAAEPGKISVSQYEATMWRFDPSLGQDRNTSPSVVMTFFYRHSWRVNPTDFGGTLASLAPPAG